MSYHEDTIDWQAVEAIDKWLDEAVAAVYQGQPLAQDWARLSKIAEELGEAIQAFIGVTGQNPRKGVTHTRGDVLDELADVAFTAIFCMQHLAKDPQYVRTLLRQKLAKIEARVPAGSLNVSSADEVGVRPSDFDHGLHP